MDMTYYLDSENIKKVLIGKNIYIFGTGVDAERLTKKFSKTLNIVAFIDNFRCGKDNYFFEKKIYSFEDYLHIQDELKVIVIAAYRYGAVIEKQLMEFGLIKGRDFYFFDDTNLFVVDDATKKYVHFLSTIWNEQAKSTSEAQIIIPFDNKHDMQPIVFAYFAKYFAKKYNASIVAYLRMLMKIDEASPVVKNIYEILGVHQLIDYHLNHEQKIQVESICKDLWAGLHTWEDWKNISIFGIHFGTTIIRDYNRFFMPQFDLRNEYSYKILTRAVSAVVFWHDYFEHNDVKIVILGDGASCDGYLRDIAISKGIPCYTFCYRMERLCLDYCTGRPYQYFDKYWSQLTADEQEMGIKWAKEHLERRIQGGTEEVSVADKNHFVFALKKKKERVLAENDKLKIVIFPHIFEEDSYHCGEHIFDDNYFAWLCHLGELSENTPGYDWYLKMHPSAGGRDAIIINKIIKKYPKIKEIPADISPYQLRDEGVKYALTVCGTIGQEYPLLGIQVINAGYNPYNCYDFTWNPRSKKEYDELILNLDRLEPKQDLEGLYRFYSLNYLYYEWPGDLFMNLFEDFPCLQIRRLDAKVMGRELGTWMYEQFMQEWTEEKHQKIVDRVEGMVKKMDERQLDVLYRKRRT